MQGVLHVHAHMYTRVCLEDLPVWCRLPLPHVQPSVRGEFPLGGVAAASCCLLRLPGPSLLDHGAHSRWREQCGCSLSLPCAHPQTRAALPTAGVHTVGRACAEAAGCWGVSGGTCSALLSLVPCSLFAGARLCSEGVPQRVAPPLRPEASVLSSDLRL